MREQRDRKKNNHTLFWIICLEVIVLIIGLMIILIGSASKSEKKDDKGKTKTQAETQMAQSELVTEAETEEENPVPRPDISEQILTLNEWSRPGKKIKHLDYVVIHYLGNPETTAQQNHDYFESLKDLQNTSMSANYVVGMDGEIIHCVPDDEVAYASNQANSYSLSVENCHPDESGKFTEDTYNALVKLVAYLTEEYHLDRERIIRHYDVTEKDCPKYFVEHEDAWEQFRDDVMAYRAECEAKAAQKAKVKQEEAEGSELTRFLEENAKN